MIVGEDEQRLVQIGIEGARNGKRSIQLLSKDAQQEQADWVKHCAASVREPGGEPEADGRIALKELKKTFTKEVSAPQFYKAFQGLGFRLGKSFERIQKVWISPERSESSQEHEGLCLIALDSGIPDHSMYDIYPGLIDSFFQTSSPVAGISLENMADDTKIFIPVSISRVRFYSKAVPDTLWCYTIVHESTVKDDELITGSHTICDDAGDVLLKIEGIVAQKTSKKAW